MADIDTSAGHPAMDYAEHKNTYHLFINMAKYGTVALVILMILMAVFLL